MAGAGNSTIRGPDRSWTVAAFLDACPAGAPVFLRHRMACVGCSLARFDTLADAARAYGLQLDRFLDELTREAATT